MFKKFWRFWLILCCLSLALGWSLVSVRNKYPPVSALDVWALSVGQGESVLLREAGGKTILFDGGPDDSVLSELSTILPFWNHHIDRLILSHNHSDHLHGLTLVLQQYTVDSIWLSGAQEKSADYTEWRHLIEEKHIPTKVVSAGYMEQFGSITLRVYHPILSAEGTTPKDQHDATVVVKATYGKESILLTGDLNEEHEQQIVDACPPPTCTLQAQVLQIPHHGSSTGLLPTFLANINPQIVFIPVGQHNHYGHPATLTLEELLAAHIPVYRTDQDGQVHFTLYADHLTSARVDGSVPR